MPDDYEPDRCCDGEDCGCMGLPPSPVCCSKRCEDAAYKYIGLSFEERRVAAGIPLYSKENEEIAFREALTWWKELKSKNGFSIMAKKDRKILDDIVTEKINSLKP